MRDRGALIGKLVEAGSAAHNQGGIGASTASLASFLRHLVDYVSAGHFDRFARLAEHAGAARAVERCYPEVARTTARVIAFHDCLASRAARRSGEQVAELLAQLGMTLEDHFVLEDYMLQAVRKLPRAA